MTDNSQLDSRVSKLENEYNHMLVDRNQNVGGMNDWFSANKGLLITFGLLGLFILLMRESACKCPNEGSGRARVHGIGTTLANRAAGKAIDYWISKFFQIDERIKAHVTVNNTGF